MCDNPSNVRLAMTAGWLMLLLSAAIAPGPITKADDWPTAAHDAARTGRADDSPAPPYQVAWQRHWPYENIATVSQLIVAGGRGFIGTMGGDGTPHGKVRAIRLADGTDLWAFDQLAGGVAHSVTWHDHAGGTVYAATTGGQIVALDAASGRLRWQSHAAPVGGFVVNPCIADGAILLGGRDGRFHAYTLDGKLKWSRDIGRPIRQSAAAADGIVYFMDESMRAHALRIADGDPLHGWPTEPLPGGSARDYWPVIAGHHILFRVAPPHQSNWTATEAVFFAQQPGVTQRNEADYDALGTPDQHRNEQLAVIDWLKANPHSQVMHVLDRRTGQPACTPGVFYTGGSGSVGNPPVLTGDDRIIVEYRTYYSVYDSKSWVNPMSAIGTLDPLTGVVTQITPSHGRDAPAPSLPWGHIWIIPDESSTFTMGGERLYVSHQGNFGVIDLAAGRTFAGVGKRDTWGGFEALSWSRQEWHGGPRSPLSIVGNRLYYVVGARVIACDGAANPSAAPNAPAPPDPPSASNPAISNPAAPDDKQPLIDALNAHVRRAVAVPRWAAFHEWRGIGRSGLSMTEPAELIGALSLAYPHLSDDLKPVVKAYVESHFDQHRPYDRVDYDDPRAGARRNYHPVHETDFRNAQHPVPGRRAQLYWLYVLADRTDNWNRIEAVYDRIKAAADDMNEKLQPVAGLDQRAHRPEVFAIANNCRDVSSLVGFVKIAERLGRANDADLARRKLDAMLEQLAAIHREVGRRCEAHLDGFVDAGEHPSRHGQSRNAGGPYVGPMHHQIIPYWTDLCPEAGQRLRELAPDATEHVARWMLRNAQGFYLVRGDTPVQEGEVFTPFYQTTMNYFHLFSTVRGADPALRRLLVDMPACEADVHYLQRLVAGIERRAP